MSRYDWNNPPPPGTEFDSPNEDSNVSGEKNESSRSSDQVSNIQIDPPVKTLCEDKLPTEKSRVRSRSKSPERRRRRRRSRSYSRERRRRSQSKSRRRRRKHSNSRSRSRSLSPSYRHRHRRHRDRSRSRSGRSKWNKSRSGSRSRSYRSDRDRRSPKKTHERRNSDYDNKERIVEEDIIGEEDMKIEDLDESVQEAELDQGPIPFKNDGSFLEMFKKMQEQQKAIEEPAQQAKKPIVPAFGKRRGGKVLKTGMVAKVRNIEDDTNHAQDAWSIYMKEVRKYKEVHCDDDSKTRPLVK